MDIVVYIYVYWCICCVGVKYFYVINWLGVVFIVEGKVIFCGKWWSVGLGLNELVIDVYLVFFVDVVIDDFEVVLLCGGECKICLVYEWICIVGYFVNLYCVIVDLEIDKIGVFVVGKCWVWIEVV